MGIMQQQVEIPVASLKSEPPTNDSQLMEWILERENLVRALKLQFVRALVSLGIVCLTSRIAVYGPVCTVVWEGGVVRLLPIPIRFQVSGFVFLSPDT